LIDVVEIPVPDDKLKDLLILFLNFSLFIMLLSNIKHPELNKTKSLRDAIIKDYYEYQNEMFL